MNGEKGKMGIIACYIVMIVSIMGIIAYIIALLYLSNSNKYWDKSYDIFFKCLVSILLLGVIIPPFIIARTKKNEA